ncbi:hypothetical protein P5673_010012, partial [Acropora cervicornis]
MFSGPVKPSSEAEKCSFLLIWVRQKGRDNCYTWSNIIIVFIFNSCVQGMSKTAEKFITALHILAQDYDFKDPDDMIQDCIVFGPVQPSTSSESEFASSKESTGTFLDGLHKYSDNLVSSKGSTLTTLSCSLLPTGTSSDGVSEFSGGGVDAPTEKTPTFFLSMGNYQRGLHSRALDSPLSHLHPTLHCLKQWSAQGDQASYWEFFRQQLEDYEISTELCHQQMSVHLLLMDKECLQILKNLSLPAKQRAKVQSCLGAVYKVWAPILINFKKLTSSCELGALTDEFIHKWFVIGANDRDLKSKLLRQK